MKPHERERALEEELRLPILEEVRPEPLTAAQQFYMAAWQFADLWRPAGAFGPSAIQRRDLEWFLDRAGVMGRLERWQAFRIVAGMDRVYRAEGQEIGSGPLRLQQARTARRLVALAEM